ncbi:hypothetical protein GGR56DRAFT_677473 [Xylariaceae sp. FL0804]|nr:hypothetical protein GGR56DRAFT_677473 [Xylariaceae sp. FL0804]
MSHYFEEALDPQGQPIACFDSSPHVGEYPDEGDFSYYTTSVAAEGRAAMNNDVIELAYLGPSFLTGMKKNIKITNPEFHHLIGTVHADLPENAEATLNAEQRLLYGTGKSHAMNVLCAGLSRLATEAGVPVPFARAAPTGIAANNVTGHTLHSLLRLPVWGNWRLFGGTYILQ